MEGEKSGAGLIDEYIAAFPEEVRERLEQMRATIKAAAPGAEEKISYGMPAFTLKGNLVYYAAWKSHIGLYPGSGEIHQVFGEELAGYEGAKGTIRFPLSERLPVELISRIVEYRVGQNLSKAAEKVGKKKGKVGP